MNDEDCGGEVQTLFRPFNDHGQQSCTCQSIGDKGENGDLCTDEHRIPHRCSVEHSGLSSARNTRTCAGADVCPPPWNAGGGLPPRGSEPCSFLRIRTHHFQPMLAVSDAR
eukprot:scaffold80_cov325-Pavlova_lutheri.AAC.24